MICFVPKILALLCNIVVVLTMAPRYYIHTLPEYLGESGYIEKFASHISKTILKLHTTYYVLAKNKSTITHHFMKMFST